MTSLALRVEAEMKAEHLKIQCETYHSLKLWTCIKRLF